MIKKHSPPSETDFFFHKEGDIPPPPPPAQEGFRPLTTKQIVTSYLPRTRGIQAADDKANSDKLPPPYKRDSGR